MNRSTSKGFSKAARWRPAHWLAVVLIGCLCLPGTSAAASGGPTKGVAAGACPGPLSLQQAVSYGLAHNPVLLAAAETVSAAGQGIEAARADFLPKLDARYRYTHWRDAPIAKLTSHEFLVGAFQTQHQNLNHWQLQLTQPLFTGFALSAQYEMAKKDRDLSEDQRAQLRLDLSRQIQWAFLHVLLGEKLLGVIRTTIKQLEAQRGNAMAYYREGLVPQNDVLKAEVALADARQREAAQAKQVSVLRLQLKRLMGFADEQPLVLVEWEKKPVKKVQRIDWRPLYQRALHERPEIRAVDDAAAKAREAIIAVRSRYFPKVSLFATAYQEGHDFLGSDNAYANDHNSAVGVAIDWNWFEGGKSRALMKQWNHRLKAIQEKRRDLEKEIRVQVEDACRQLKVAQANLETARIAVRQAKENLRMTKAQYQQQVVVFSEVLDAQVYLQQAKTNYFRALYGYRLAWVDLERAIGGPLQNIPLVGTKTG